MTATSADPVAASLGADVRSTVGLVWTVLVTSWRTSVADRAVLIADFVIATTAPFLFQAAIWLTIGDGVTGFSYSTVGATLLYYAVAIGFSRLNNGYDVVERLTLDADDGRIEVWLTKPVGLITLRLGGYLGEGLLYTVPLLVGCIVWSVSHQGVVASLCQLPLWLVIIALGQVVVFFVSFAIGLGAFTHFRSSFLISAILFANVALSGVLFPAELWWSSTRFLYRYNPFYVTVGGSADTVLDGSYRALLHHIAVLAAWGAVAVKLARARWRRVTARSLVVAS